jgi:hypothetical protein
LYATAFLIASSDFYLSVISMPISMIVVEPSAPVKAKSKI